MTDANAIEFTTLSNIRSTKSNRHSMMAAELVDFLGGVEVDTKTEAPLFKFAAFRGARNDDNVLSVYGVELDHDAETLSPDEITETLGHAGIEAFVRDSWTEGRSQIYAPLRNSISRVDFWNTDDLREERAAMVARIKALFPGHEFDPASDSLSQSFFYAKPKGKTRRVRYVKGHRRIDEATELAQPIERKVSRVIPSYLSRPLFESAVEAIPNDARFIERGAWIAVGSAIYNEAEGADWGRDLWLDFCERWEDGEYNKRDALAAWKSFRKSAKVGGEHIVRLAEKYGWHEHNRALLFEMDDDEDDIRKGPLTFRSPRECEGTDSRPYVWKGVLAQGDVGCIFGDPGCGKSTFAPYLAYRIAQGNEAFGKKVRKGTVFYVAAEDEAGMRNRVTALRKHYGEADNFQLVSGVSNLADLELRYLMKAVEREGPMLVVIDTLAMAFPTMEENSSESMGKVAKVARALTKFGATVLLIHHGTKDGGQTPRGHSVLNGALDMSMHMTRTETGLIRGELKKNRNGAIDHLFLCSAQVENIGKDEDGDFVTAVYASETDAVPEGPKLTLQESDILEFVRTCPEMSERDQRRELTVQGVVSNSPKHESRCKAVNRGLKRLKELEIISNKRGSYRIRHPDIKDMSGQIPQCLGQTRTHPFRGVRTSGLGPSRGGRGAAVTERKTSRDSANFKMDSAK